MEDVFEYKCRNAWKMMNDSLSISLTILLTINQREPKKNEVIIVFTKKNTC